MTAMIFGNAFVLRIHREKCAVQFSVGARRKRAYNHHRGFDSEISCRRMSQFAVMERGLAFLGRPP